MADGMKPGQNDNNNDLTKSNRFEMSKSATNKLVIMNDYMNNLESTEPLSGSLG